VKLFETDFTAYDGRSHVLGASILFAVDGFCREVFPAAAEALFCIRRAKFSLKTDCNGDIIFSDDRMDPPDPESCAATIDASLGEHSFLAWFVPNAGKKVSRNVPSNHYIADIVAEHPFEGRCLVRAASCEELLRILVDANKHVQLQSPPLRGRKWVSELVYIEKLDILCADSSVETEVTVRNLANREAVGRTFTLSETCFSDMTGTKQTIRVAFSFH
jgi:hypothetical protein